LIKALILRFLSQKSVVGVKNARKTNVFQVVVNQRFTKTRKISSRDCYLFVLRLLFFRVAIAIFSRRDRGFVAAACRHQMDVKSGSGA
jgi:hypothetical protein